MNRLLFLVVLIAGFSALALSAKKDWFSIPRGDFDAISMQGDIIAKSASCVPLYQGLTLVFAVCLVGTWAHELRWSRVSVVVGCGMVIMPLTFPYAVMILDPEIAGEATWLQMQFENLLWLGGDINTSQEMARMTWKHKVHIVDAPRQVAVVELPGWSPWQMGMTRLPHLVDWLGYTNPFCQFVRKGWSLNVIGSSLLLMCTFVDHGRVKFQRAKFALATVSAGSILFCFFAWSAPLLASRHIANSAKNVTEGDCATGLAYLEAAAKRFPVLKEDTFFIAQKGLLDNQLERNTGYRDIYTATLLEQDGKYSQAFEIFSRLKEDPSSSRQIKREAGRAVLRYAIHSLNSGDIAEAIGQLAMVLKNEPCNLKAIYMLQLAMLRSGQYEKMFPLVDHTYASCDHFRFPTKKVLLSSSQQHATMAAMLMRDEQLTWARHLRATRP